MPSILVEAPKAPLMTGDIAAFVSAYSLHEYLGRGAYGEVKKCVSRVDGSSFAVKELDKRRMDKGAEEATEREIEISRDLDHDNVVRMHCCFRSPVAYHIVMELICGGELFDAIVERDHYSEKDALTCIRQVLLALQYCHGRKIIHRDLKPENLLLSRKMNSSESMDGVVIKLADFGLALELPDNVDRIQADTRGTPYCIAPETLREQPLGPPVDMWACGAVFYFMLVGMPPFWPGEGSYGQQQMYVRIVAGKYTFDNPEWQSVSARTRELLKKMLLVDQDERVTASESLRCVTSLMGATYLRSLHRQETLHRMRAFRGKQRLNHNGVLQLIAARRRIMENRDKSVNEGTPTFFRRSSAESTADRSENGSAASSESDKESSCNSSTSNLAPAELPKRKRRRSKSMKEKREQHLEDIFDRCLRMVSKPRALAHTETRVSMQPVVTQAEATADGSAGSADGPAAHACAKVKVRVRSTASYEGNAETNRSVEMVGVETVVRERHQRRVSMLAELEPGNHRLEWSQFEDDTLESPADDCLNLNLSKSFPQTKLAVSSIPGTPAGPGPQRSPGRSLRHSSVATVLEESGSSTDSSAGATPELVRRRGASDPTSSSAATASSAGVPASAVATGSPRPCGQAPLADGVPGTGKSPSPRLCV